MSRDWNVLKITVRNWYILVLSGTVMENLNEGITVVGCISFEVYWLRRTDVSLSSCFSRVVLLRGLFAELLNV